MAGTIYAIMRQKRNTYAFFQQDNTLLEDGQLGIINSGQYKNCFKIGDGVTRWNTLPWVTDYQLLFNKPQVNGVTLSGNVSLSQLGVASAASLTTETQTRQQADAALTQALETEKTTRESAESALVFRHDCNCGMTCFIMGDIETKGEGIYATEEIQGNTHEG